MKRILSIQSAVTLGAVGNTMAAAVLTVAGHQLACVDTVQLSAHPGHGFRAGGHISDEDFTSLIDGLKRLQCLTEIDAIMTGYIGSVGQIEPIASILADFSHADRQKPILVDPVFGDHGKLYVDEAIAANIKTRLIPHATLITPNVFEMSWLTGTTIANVDDATAAAKILFNENEYAGSIVVTSVPHLSGIADVLFTDDDIFIYAKPSSGRDFPGGGDLFSALVMLTLIEGQSVVEAVARASMLTSKIFDKTIALHRDDIALEAIAPFIAPQV